MEARKIKILQEQEVACAHCGKMNLVKLERETIQAPEPGEYEIRFRVEKGNQTKLGEE